MVLLSSLILLRLLAFAEACLLPYERAGGLRDGGIRRRQSPEWDRYFELLANHSIPIASNATDRFQGGTVPPRGLGSRLNATITTSMNVVEMRTAIDGLVGEFGVEFFEFPERTHDGAVMFGVRAGGTSCDATTHRVLITGGIHARERSVPDGLIYFLSDLLWAQREGTGLLYGERSFSRSDVTRALSAGVIIVPVLNPDGVAYDRATNFCWRKNRNPNGAVDLNRNFDFLWDFERHFAFGVDAASNDPSDQAYAGTAPFSEPETRNAKWALDTHKDVGWFADVHTFSDLVLYPWGDDDNQVTIPSQNFSNPAFDGKRGLPNDTLETGYLSYIDRADWDAGVEVSKRIALAMREGAGDSRPIRAQQSFALYPASGTTSDYALARSLQDPSLTKVMGLALEVGVGNAALMEEACPFYVNLEEFNANLREIGAGMMELLLYVAEREGVTSGTSCADGSQSNAPRPENKAVQVSYSISAALLAILGTAATAGFK